MHSRGSARTIIGAFALTAANVGCLAPTFRITGSSPSVCYGIKCSYVAITVPVHIDHNLVGFIWNEFRLDVSKETIHLGKALIERLTLANVEGLTSSGTGS